MVDHAKYTVELRKIVESGINIFDFPYLFYNEEKRSDFEKKFIRHFYFREIGCETVDRFKFYLQDKMDTVFPLYNKMLEAATIEYSILDNYKLTEEITISRENQGKTSGISSTVGQVQGTQETESKQNRVTDTTGKVTNEGTDTETVTTDTTTKDTATGSTSGSKTTNGKTDTTGNTIKKFLDTPQGQTDLSATTYLTTLNHDTETATVNNNGTETTTGSSSSESNGTNNSKTELERNTNSTQNTTGKETASDTLNGSVHDEQKTTHDNNTRTYVDNRTAETQTTVRKGNIGVDTDSDAIEKHLRLQRTLTQIELLFFNECEDLFMMVY